MVSPWVQPCTMTVESNGAALAEPLVAANAGNPHECHT
jgi:hypothetical protein